VDAPAPNPQSNVRIGSNSASCDRGDKTVSLSSAKAARRCGSYSLIQETAIRIVRARNHWQGSGGLVSSRVQTGDFRETHAGANRGQPLGCRSV